jgi:hypothetical protein
MALDAGAMGRAFRCIDDCFQQLYYVVLVSGGTQNIAPAAAILLKTPRNRASNSLFTQLSNEICVAISITCRRIQTLTLVIGMQLTPWKQTEWVDIESGAISRKLRFQQLS